ncbi:MAG: aspartate kinase [Oscillospiraceae bacterium]|nr:aspartate kinase [Oscillospiraceae bacterium]
MTLLGRKKETALLKVTKFGGSSMADAGQYRKVRSILEADPARKVVIVSAAGKRDKKDHKITDLLYLTYAHTQYGVDYSRIFDMIYDRHIQIRDDLGVDLNMERELKDIRVRLDEKSISQDELVSRGEYLSAKLMAAFLDFEFVDAADWIRFNLDGSVDRETSYELLRRRVGKKGIVIPGFYGVMPDGHIRTFSRGGSDITGALAAAALDADVYENWTDVSGILMADPRIVENPQAIPQVTYDELRELSYSGAQVLHEGTIFPVREKNIPVNIRNTNAPMDPGTMIQESFDSPIDPDRFITGITGKKNFSIISMSKRGMSNEVGVLRKLLTVLERHNISIDYAPNGIDNVSVVMPTESIEPCLYQILDEIKRDVNPDTLDVHDQIAVVAAVGRHMAYRPGISGKIFAALGKAGINIRMINQGPDELNIIFGVDNKDFEAAIRVLYNSFAK